MSSVNKFVFFQRYCSIFFIKLKLEHWWRIWPKSKSADQSFWRSVMDQKTAICAPLETNPFQNQTWALAYSQVSSLVWITSMSFRTPSSFTHQKALTTCRIKNRHWFRGTSGHKRQSTTTDIPRCCQRTSGLMGASWQTDLSLLMTVIDLSLRGAVSNSYL